MPLTATAPPPSEGAGSPEPRPTVRALLLDRAGRVLLHAFADPGVHRPGATPTDAPTWFPPGGGLDAGEPPAAGLDRELREETGFTDVRWGPWVWRRTVDLMVHGRLRRVEEAYRLGRVDGDAPAPHPTAFEAWEATAYRGYRWWPLAELARADLRLFPPRLPARLAALLADGPPPEPIDISADG